MTILEKYSEHFNFANFGKPIKVPGGQKWTYRPYPHLEITMEYTYSQGYLLITARDAIEQKIGIQTIGNARLIGDKLIIC